MGSIQFILNKSSPFGSAIYTKTFGRITVKPAYNGNPRDSNIIRATVIYSTYQAGTVLNKKYLTYEGWNFNSGNYLFTTDTK